MQTILIYTVTQNCIYNLRVSLPLPYSSFLQNKQASCSDPWCHLHPKIGKRTEWGISHLASFLIPSATLGVTRYHPRLTNNKIEAQRLKFGLVQTSLAIAELFEKTNHLLYDFVPMFSSWFLFLPRSPGGDKSCDPHWQRRSASPSKSRNPWMLLPGLSPSLVCLALLWSLQEDHGTSSRIRDKGPISRLKCLVNFFSLAQGSLKTLLSLALIKAPLS